MDGHFDAGRVVAVEAPHAAAGGRARRTPAALARRRRPATAETEEYGQSKK